MRAEHADAGCEQVDVAAGGREGARVPVGVDAPTTSPSRPSSAAGYDGAVAALAAVTGGSDEQHALLRRVSDRRALGRRGLRAAQAQVDDASAVVDGPDDAGRLVDVGERRAAVRLDDHQMAWPPKPAASDATNVPWPTVSSTPVEPLVTL